LAGWTHWDSGRYLIIAVHGYRHGSNLVRFPGYPAAIGAIARIPGASPVRAGLGVTIAAGLAAWGLTRLGMTLTGDRRASLLTAALSAVAPGSIVLSMLHAEALKRVTTFPRYELNANRSPCP